MNSIYFAIILIVVILFSVSYHVPKRTRKINAVISDLEALLLRSPEKDKYAIKENIVFFKALKSLASYVRWALGRRRKIIPDQLLEIADLSLPTWEKELYDDLAFVERKNFPGLSKPLKRMILSHLQTQQTTILDIGCGGMEVERQVIIDYLKNGTRGAPVFVGIDLAPQAWDAVNDTFRDMKDNVTLKQIKNIKELKSHYGDKPTILFHCGDALEIAQLHGERFDLIVSSRFRHHLNADQKNLFDHVGANIAKASIEYDDYRTALSWIPPLLTAWNRPILLNGAIFSQIRQPWKKDLIKERRDSKTKIVFFSPPGSYARIRTK